jgi:PhnB protein
MAGKVKAIPDGYQTLTPYLVIKGAAEAIEFYKKALGAEEILRMGGPDGKVMHAELQIGTSRFMLADEFPEMGHKSPVTLGGSPVGMMVYVDDVDTLSKRATTAGMKVERPVKNEFYGDRTGSFVDPYGHKWTISTHVEDVSPEEMAKRMKAAGSEKV